MGFFSNPLKKHKKVKNAIKGVAKAGIPSQSPLSGVVGRGGGGGGGMKMSGPAPMQQAQLPAARRADGRMGNTASSGPMRQPLAEGGKVKKKK